jgi:hypothetical protein
MRRGAVPLPRPVPTAMASPMPQGPSLQETLLPKMNAVVSLATR